VTAVYVLFWLISSSVWADAVTKIKMYTDPKEYFDDEFACECSGSSKCVAAVCSVTNHGNYATINVSIVSAVHFFRFDDLSRSRLLHPSVWNCFHSFSLVGWSFCLPVC